MLIWKHKGYMNKRSCGSLKALSEWSIKKGKLPDAGCIPWCRLLKCNPKSRLDLYQDMLLGNFQMRGASHGVGSLCPREGLGFGNGMTIDPGKVWVLVMEWQLVHIVVSLLEISTSMTNNFRHWRSQIRHNFSFIRIYDEKQFVIEVASYLNFYDESRNSS